MENLVVLVTGGASGIGEGTVRRFVKGGASVAILDLPSSNGAKIADELGVNCVFYPVDVRDEKQIEGCIADIRQKFNRLDVLVNSAGINLGCHVDECEGKGMENVQAVFDVNAVGTYKMVAAAARLMKGNPPGADGERGVIVNLTSASAMDGPVKFSAYSGTKGAIASMTLPLARDLARYGIRVNSIAPGIIATPMFAEVGEEVHFGPVLFPKRIGRPDEVAALVQHIVENKYMNAATIRLDAGFR